MLNYQKNGIYPKVLTNIEWAVIAAIRTQLSIYPMNEYQFFQDEKRKANKMVEKGLLIKKTERTYIVTKLGESLIERKT